MPEFNVPCGDVRAADHTWLIAGNKQIVDALLAYAETEEGTAALENLYSISGLQEADDSFYDQFRADLGFTADAMAKLTPQVWLYEFP